jgi:hypothetical protein
MVEPLDTALQKGHSQHKKWTQAYFRLINFL